MQIDGSILSLKLSRLLQMDGLRGMAVVYVLLLHSAQQLDATYKISGIKNIVLGGTIGVPVFFALADFYFFLHLPVVSMKDHYLFQFLSFMSEDFFE